MNHFITPGYPTCKYMLDNSSKNTVIICSNIGNIISQCLGSLPEETVLHLCE